MPQDEITYRNILENMRDGVMTIGRDGRILSFNQAAERILGLPRDEVLGHSFGEIFLTREGNDDFNQTILNAVYEAETVHNNVVPFQTGSHTLILEVTTSFLTPASGDTKGAAVIAVFDDRTEVERLREAEVKLTAELKEKHKELQGSYVELEESNRSLKAALKKVQVIRLISTGMVIILFVSLGWYTWKKSSLIPSTWATFRPQQEPGTQVRTFAVTPRRLSDGISLKGSLKPISVINIVSPFSGTVGEKLFEYGEAVEKGQVLLRMDTAETQVKFREAEVVVSEAQEKVKELENWENGDEVAKAKRSITRSKLTMDSQKKTLDETERLYKKGIVPANEYENSQQQYRNAQMDHESSLLELKSILAKANPENKKNARLKLQNARQKYQELQAQLQQAEIKAPVSGTILMPELAGDKDKKAKILEKGVSFSQGEILTSIGNTEGLSVTTQVDETEVVRIKHGQPVKISGEAFPGMVFAGKVSHISSQAGRGEEGGKKPTFTVTVSITDLKGEGREKIRLGMSANLMITILDKPQALLVPIPAVHQDGGGPFVTVRDKASGQMKKVKIQTGITTLDSVEILEGIKAGDDIVIGN